MYIGSRTSSEFNVKIFKKTILKNLDKIRRFSEKVRETTRGTNRSSCRPLTFSEKPKDEITRAPKRRPCISSDFFRKTEGEIPRGTKRS